MLLKSPVATLVATVFLATLFASLSATVSVARDASLENVNAVRPIPLLNASRAVTAAGTGSHDGGGDKVYLRSITALVFSENARARSRHGRPRAQLSCVGGSAAGVFWGSDRYPRVVQCSNIGWDGSSIQWRCEATLEDGLTFGDTAVLCEGYDRPGDEYIYRGSCRLEYTLNFVKFEVSFVHVMYASFLTLAMLWFYWQCRFWLHSRVAKIERAIDSRVGYKGAGVEEDGLPTASYGATAGSATASAGYTGKPLE